MLVPEALVNERPWRVEEPKTWREPLAPRFVEETEVNDDCPETFNVPSIMELAVVLIVPVAEIKARTELALFLAWKRSLVWEEVA